jgi:hypothetical protein
MMRACARHEDDELVVARSTPCLAIRAIPTRRATIARTAESFRSGRTSEGIDVELSEDQRARLDQVSAIELGFPHDFINRTRQSEFVLGDAHDRIDDHRADRSGLAVPR